MPKRFNPPPHWPAQPEGWSPPDGWQPDPAWGPPPPGWQLWTPTNRKTFLWAFLSAALLYPVTLAALAVALDLTSYQLGYAVGSLLLPFLVAAVAVGAMAGETDRPWRWWFYPAAVALGVLAVAVAAKLAFHSTLWPPDDGT